MPQRARQRGEDGAVVDADRRRRRALALAGLARPRQHFIQQRLTAVGPFAFGQGIIAFGHPRDQVVELCVQHLDVTAVDTADGADMKIPISAAQCDQAVLASHHDDRGIEGTAQYFTEIELGGDRPQNLQQEVALTYSEIREH